MLFGKAPMQLVRTICLLIIFGVVFDAVRPGNIPSTARVIRCDCPLSATPSFPVNNDMIRRAGPVSKTSFLHTASGNGAPAPTSPEKRTPLDGET